jgi:RNA polymerase sigma factor (sigma-70 family)
MTGDDDDDNLALRKFSATGCGEAFAVLVTRHISLVYGVCRRQLRDVHLAEDATQAVFVILARKAPRIAPQTILPGWLHQTARHVCANIRRTNARRLIHEKEAAQVKQSDIGAPQAQTVAESSLVDDALAKLALDDRNAILLRFLEGRTFHEVGKVLSISEEAARKRVERGLERLRRLLTPHGAAVISSTAVMTILCQSAQAVPAHLASSAVAAAMGGKGSAAAAIAKGTLLMVVHSKIQIVAAVVGVAFIGVILALTVGGDLTSPARTRDLALTVQQSPRASPQRPRGPSFSQTRRLFTTIEAESFDEQLAIDRSGQTFIRPRAAPAWALFRGVDLGEGPASVITHLARASEGSGTIEVRLDRPDGQIIAALEPRPTPGWQIFDSQVTSVIGVPPGGVHDVYLVFSGQAPAMVDWIRFLGKPRSAFEQIEAENYDAARGIDNLQTKIGKLDPGDLVRFSQVDFGERGATQILVRLAVPVSHAGSDIEVRLGAPDAPPHAVLQAQPTPWWNVFATQQAKMQSVRGVHDVYLTFAGRNGVCDIDWIRFEPAN